MKRLLVILLLCMLPLAALAEDGFVTREELVSWGAGDMPMNYPVAVKPGFEEAAKEYLAEHPDWPIELLLGDLREWLGDSLTGALSVMALDLHGEELVLMLDRSDGMLILRVATWDGSEYDVQENINVPAGSTLDTAHLEDGETGFWYLRGEDEWVYVGFHRGSDGRWELASQNNGVLRFSWAGVTDASFTLRNLRVGTYPWDNFWSIDIASLPLDLDGALAFRNTDGWAVVNNPNPEDRLHLRAKPDKGATSLGKFYNGTPVRVLGTQGAWTHVKLGLDGLEGWMMTEYLAFGTAMDAVGAAWPELGLTEAEYAVPVHAVRREPKQNAAVAWEMDTFSIYDWAIIGVAGDDWYVLMDEQGRVGYVPQAWYSAGNG